MWIVVATDFTEADARAYIRMNWVDSTPYSVAKSIRHSNPKYKDLSDEDFDKRWYRCTRAEFEARKGGFLAKEDEKAAADMAKLEAKKADKAKLGAEKEKAEEEKAAKEVPKEE